MKLSDLGLNLKFKQTNNREHAAVTPLERRGDGMGGTRRVAEFGVLRARGSGWLGNSVAEQNARLDACANMPCIFQCQSEVSMTQTYDDKLTSYFADARTEIEPLLPASSERVLEIGCGAGQTMRWLIETNRAKKAWGLELFEPAAELSRKYFEEVRVGDAEAMIETIFEGMQFDLILCLDVLEHMIDPWQFVGSLERLLAPGGKIIVSIPNIRCLKVLIPLAFFGRWRYEKDGILDRTHLRFFTRESAISLVESQVFRFERCIAFTERRTRLFLLNRLTFGWLENMTAKQFLIACTRVEKTHI